MATQITVDADLEFSFELQGSRRVTGVLTGSGQALELQVSSPFLFAGRSDSGFIRGLAQTLAARGLRMRVVAPSGPLVTLGAARTSWLQRRVTGSRHIRIERAAGLWSLLRGRAYAPSGGALPTAALLPPATLFPLAPTMRRRPRQPVTITHDPNRGGNPRLTLSLGPYPKPGDRPTTFFLRDDETTIGSDPDCDIVLAGLQPLHAVVRHDEEDEYVLMPTNSADARVHGAFVDRARLRTGSGIDLGSWHLSYFREEYADHGRPYGGRIGGELGHQRPQPARERIQQQPQGRS